MKVQQFQEYMARQGLKVSGKMACGMANGYPVLVNFVGPKVWNLTFNAVVVDFKGVQQQLKPLLKGMGSAAYNAEALKVTLSVTDQSYDMVFQNVMNNVLSVLHQCGAAPSQTCPVCAEPGCDTLILYQDAYRPVHNHCMERVTETARRQAEDNLNNGNYFTGILGAILGMIVGIIPSLLTIIFLESIYSLLFALIPMAIYFGYKLCKGKLNKAPLVISIVLSVVAVYVIEIVLLIYTVIAEFGVPFGTALSATMELLGSGDTWSAITQDAVSSFIFTALGIFIAWGYISRTAQTPVRAVEAVMVTRMPYQAPQAQPVMAGAPVPASVSVPAAVPVSAQPGKDAAKAAEELIEK